MRRPALVLVVLLLLTGCSSHEPRVPREFEGTGRIHGTFHVGDRTLQDGWVEMIELTGPEGERCGPGDCGLTVDGLLVGSPWNPGRWQVLPPPVEGWKPPHVEVVVEQGKLTTFEASYEPA